jgi:hypothetical protein
MPETHHLGRIAYTAYAASTGGKTFDGRDMPQWIDVPMRIKDAWQAAAVAARDDGVASREVSAPAPKADPGEFDGDCG